MNARLSALVDGKQVDVQENARHQVLLPSRGSSPRDRIETWGMPD